MRNFQAVAKSVFEGPGATTLLLLALVALVVLIYIAVLRKGPEADRLVMIIRALAEFWRRKD